MDREVRISDMVAHARWCKRDAPTWLENATWWTERLYVNDVGMKKDGTMTTSASDVDAKASSASDGGTGSGGGSVADET